MKKYLPLLIVFGIVFHFAGTSPAQSVFRIPQQSLRAQKYAPDEIIVKFKDGTSESQISSLNKRFKTKQLQRLKKLGARKYKIKSGKSVEEMVAAFSQTSCARVHPIGDETAKSGVCRVGAGQVRTWVVSLGSLKIRRLQVYPGAKIRPCLKPAPCRC